MWNTHNIRWNIFKDRFDYVSAQTKIEYTYTHLSLERMSACPTGEGRGKYPKSNFICPNGEVVRSTKGGSTRQRIVDPSPNLSPGEENYICPNGEVPEGGRGLCKQMQVNPPLSQATSPPSGEMLYTFPKENREEVVCLA